MRVRILEKLPMCLYEKECPNFLALEVKRDLCNRCIFQSKLDIPKLIKDRASQKGN